MSANITTGNYDTVVQNYMDLFTGHTAYFTDLGLKLFAVFSVIQLTIVALKSTTGENLESQMIKIGTLLLSLSIFYGMILMGASMLPVLINGFVDAGSALSNVHSLTPSSIIDQGLGISFLFLKNIGMLGLIKHPVVTLGTVIMICCIIWMYTKIASEMALLLCKTYFFISLNGFFFSLASLEILKETANNYLRTLFGLGLQMMTFYILLGVGIQMGEKWVLLLNQMKSNWVDPSPFIIITISISFFYLMVMNLPPMAAQMVGFQGFRNQGYGGIESAAMAGSVIGGALTTAATGAGGAARGIGHAAGIISKTLVSNGGPGTLSKAAAKYVSGSIGKAGVDTVMRRNQSMSFGQKVNAHVASKVANHSSAPNKNFESNNVEEKGE